MFRTVRDATIPPRTGYTIAHETPSEKIGAGGMGDVDEVR
jgi:hypothetical protein